MHFLARGCIIDTCCEVSVLTKCVVNVFRASFIRTHCNARTSVYISSYCSMHSRHSYRGVHTICARAYNAAVTLRHVASIMGFPAGERPRSVSSTRISNPFSPSLFLLPYLTFIVSPVCPSILEIWQTSKWRMTSITKWKGKKERGSNLFYTEKI